MPPGTRRIGEGQSTDYPSITYRLLIDIWWVGTGGQEPRRKGAGGGRKKGRKQESQGGGNREKFKKILRHVVILYFAIQMGQREGNCTTTERAGSRSKWYRKWEEKLREAEVSDPGWGDSHMERTGMLVGNFEIYP